MIYLIFKKKKTILIKLFKKKVIKNSISLTKRKFSKVIVLMTKINKLTIPLKLSVNPKKFQSNNY